MVAGPGTAGDFDSRSKSDRIPPFYAQKCRIWLSASHKKQSPANGKKRQSRRHYGNKWQYQNSVQCPIHRRSIYPVIVVFASSRRLFCGRTPEPIRRRRSDGVTGYGNSRTAAAATADLWKFYRAGRSAGQSKVIHGGWGLTYAVTGKYGLSYEPPEGRAKGHIPAGLRPAIPTITEFVNCRRYACAKARGMAAMGPGRSRCA